IQLLDSALKRNTLLCLGCSESKLFLALMLAKELASPTRLQRSQGGKRTFYLTDTDDDVEMLYQTLPHHTDLQVEFCYPHSLLEDDTQDEISGTQMSLQKWCLLVDSSSILVCSGHLFLTALCKNYIDLKEVNLLVFDNCHRAVEVENHPYKEIVNGIKSLPQKSDQPHILGVTASIAGTDCSDPLKLQQTISEMEEAMFSYAETSMLILSERFGCRPKESVVQCLDLELDDEQEVLKDTLEEMLEQNYYFFSDCRIAVDETVDNRDPRETPMQVLSQCLNILNVLGSWCTASISEYFVMQLEKIVKCEKNEIHKKFLRCVITTLRVLIKEFEKQFHPDYHVNELLEYTTPKVRELVKVLRKYKPEVDFIIVSNGDSFNDDEEFSDLSDEDDDSIMSDSDGEDNSGEPFNGSSKPMHIAVKRTADGGHERIMTFSEEEEKNLCGIVFVENRYIAFGLNKVIEEVCSWDENLCFVKSCHVTGQGLRSANGKPRVNRTYKRQEEALRKFRTQECNLVIATLELEEGIDIPKCNLVIRFDPPKDFRAYALSKGRARARDAAYVILLDDENFEGFNTSLKVFKGIEQVLLGENRSLQAIRSNIPGEDADNEYDSKDDDDSDASSDERDNLPPYCTMPHSLSSPHVTLQGAIALINRYCAKLPSDAFTHLTPQCRIEKLDGYAPSYIANLRLPINSPVKEELKGPAMRTKKLAKMAVALKMCEILHKKGELDENLVPVGKEMFLYEEEEEWVNEEDLAGQARPGTTKRKQYYIKKTTDALLQCRPKPGQPCFLYLINLKLTGPITDEQNTRGRVIYAPEDTVQTLGILLSKKIPLMPYFPVYTRSGEVTASIDLQQTDLICSEDEINRLLNFHHFVFSGVLHLEKDPMEFDCVNADCGYIIVPLNGTRLKILTIEWSFVDKVIDFIKVEKRAGFSKKSGDESFQFCLDDFQDAVVMPSYRNIDQPQHFYVAEIRHDLNPLSPFPSPELYKTFQDYYTTKYGLMITNTEQPLLDVDHTSARLNLLTPRYMNQKGVALPTSSAETKRARRENLQQKQILVPELCDVHVFPASLWRKTVCLPAILYRANYLLLADELRRKISRETGIGVEELPPGFRFSKLDFGFDTSPEKLMDAEVNCNKKISSNIKEESAERSPDPVLCCMEKDSSNNRMIKESLISVDKDETGSANVTTDNYNATAAAEDIHVIKFSFNTDEPGVKCKEAKEPSPPDNKKESSPTDSKKECNPPDSKKELPNENTENRLTFDLTRVKSPLETQQRNTELEIGVWKSKTNHSLCQPTFSCVTTGSLTSISLDEDRDPQTFVGPSPCLIMQALTMSNANDFFSLERLETIGDSFLKYAITVYLYCSYPGIHEGKLSYLRSKQVSNYNLYRLGRRKGLAECMVSTKFEPYENWLPPGYVINDERRRGPVPKVVIVTPGSKINNSLRNFYLDETADAAKRDEAILFNKELEWIQQSQEADQQEEVQEPNNDMTPYSLQCHHGLPDKSVADCVEALIGCYLTTCGRKAALIFMSWLGLRVLPKKKKLILDVSKIEEHEKSSLSEQEFDELRCPPSPMFSNTPANVAKLNHLLQGFDSLEEKICYKFRDRSYLLQAFTHASYHYNTITDCYQRVEFLGDAILDYVITRHLYEDSQKYSPGILTDLRSALVNNNIFAALAVKWGFHKYFKAISPSLFQVIDKFVKRQKEKKEDDIDIDEEFRELSLEENEPEENTEEDDEEEEEVEMEIPKALGDIFESVAGAIYLDSGMSLDTVWRVYYRMMKPHIDKYLKSIPKSPVRELLETEPETAKFERPERTMNGKVRVTVNVVGKGVFSGVGRNYRIAKSAAAKKALRSIRTLNQNLMN
ncbi:unnamed protein product, partial [Lymnaea stagnalis]